MICTRSMRVISDDECQSLTQKLRVSPWTTKVAPSIITGTGVASVPSRSSSRSSGTYWRNCSNWRTTADSSTSAGGSSTGSSDSSSSRDSVCWFLFLTTGIRSAPDPQPLLQILAQLGRFDALLTPGVAVADGDGLVFERLVIDGDAEGRADLVLAGVELADAARVVVDGAHRGLQLLPDALRHRDDLGLVLREREHGDLDGRELWVQTQNHPLLALVGRLLGVGVHQDGEHRAVDPGRGLDDVGVVTLLRRLVEVGEVVRRVGVEAFALRVLRLLRVRHQVEVGAVGDAHQLVPLPLPVLALWEEAVVDVHGALGVVGELLLRLLVEAQVGGADAEVNEPLVAVVDPLLMHALVLAGAHEVLHLHLLELARAEDEVAGRDLVAERLADLRDAEGNLPPQRRLHVQEVDEDALRRLGPEVSQRVRVVFRRRCADGRAE